MAAAGRLWGQSPAVADNAWLEGEERQVALGPPTPALGWGYKYSP